MVMSTDRKGVGDTVFDQALRVLDFIAKSDTGFRRLFAQIGVRPLFVTSDDLFQDPGSVVRRIAQALDVPVNEVSLEQSISHGGAYKRDSIRQRRLTDFGPKLKELAFRKR
jgi:LPS sulfotransferase NodH